MREEKGEGRGKTGEGERWSERAEKEEGERGRAREKRERKKETPACSPYCRMTFCSTVNGFLCCKLKIHRSVVNVSFDHSRFPIVWFK